MSMTTRFLTLLSCGLLLAGGGCARTDDGSVVIPKPLDARRIWDRDPSPPQTPPVASGANVFPVVAPPRRTPRSRAPQASAAPGPNERTVNCGTALQPGSQTGGRVRVVCE